MAGMCARVGIAMLLMLLMLVASAFGASAQAHVRECGVARTEDGGRFAVTVLKGDARCRLARRVLRVYFSGGGRHHDGSSSADSYVVIGRWYCGSGTGGGACRRGGTDYSTAPDRIGGQFCEQVSAPRACAREAVQARRAGSCRDGLLYAPRNGGFALIVDDLRVHGISCRRGLGIAGASAAGEPLPGAWTCHYDSERLLTACRRDRRHSLTYVFGGDAG
jgi:hypothetical protein